MQLFTGWKGTASPERWIKVLDMNNNALLPNDNVITLSNNAGGLESSEGEEIMVVRKGTKFDLYIDGELVYSDEYAQLSKAGYCGFFICDATGTFSECSYTTIKKEVVTSSETTTSPGTGDGNAIALWGVVMVLAAVVPCAYFINKKRHGYKKNQ